MRSHWLLRIWLIVVWVALWGDVSFANVASGALLGLLLPAALSVAPQVRVPLRPLAQLRYVVFFLGNLVKSSIDVARYILSFRAEIREGILALPLHDPTDDLVAAVVSSSITLTPGTLTLNVEDSIDSDGRPRRTLYVHVLHLPSTEATRTELATVEYMALQAFGRSEAAAAMADPRRPQRAHAAAQGEEPR